MQIIPIQKSILFEIKVKGVRYYLAGNIDESFDGKSLSEMSIEDAKRMIEEQLKFIPPMGTTKEPDLLNLWQTMTTNSEDKVKAIAGMIAENKQEYYNVGRTAAEAIPNGSECPWYVIGLIHLMECSLSWKRHLHNGDPLTARTINVPAGRPRKGNPPFTWHQSAVDAIRMLDFNNASYKNQWDYVPFILQKLEEYNGLGYRSKGIYSPYLWSGTNHYTKGKYTADGKFDPEAVSQQIGVAPILSRLLAM